MHAAVSVLQKCLGTVIESMHATRAQALLKAVEALLLSRRLILMDLARAWPGAEHVRAPLKCLDRLLSNSHLQAQREAFYQAMLSWLIRQPTPIILIDWCELHADCRWQLLRAAIPVGGRSMTVLDRVFPQSMKGSPEAEQRFLKRLQALLPVGCTPILVTDAGFRTPWFRAVAKLGWHYLGRMRNRTKIQLAGGAWFDNRELCSQACAQAQRFTEVATVIERPWTVDLVLYQKPAQGRVCRTHQGTRRRQAGSLKAARREREPWLLASSTSLRHLSPQQLVNLYAKRMQIEESFRDLKCERFGCAFRYSLTRRPERIAILLLIHALATFAAWLAALSLPMADALKRYGGIHSKRTQPHYCLLRLGWEALRRIDRRCTPAALYQAFCQPPLTFLTQLEIPS